MSSSILQGEEGPPPPSSMGVGRVGTAKWKKKKLAPNVFGRAEKYGRNFRPMYNRASAGAGQTGYTKKRVPKKEKSKIIGGALAQNFSRDYWRSTGKVDFQDKRSGPLSVFFAQIKEVEQPLEERAWRDFEEEESFEQHQTYVARAKFADAVARKKNRLAQHAKERQNALHLNQGLQAGIKQQLREKRIAEQEEREPEMFLVSDEPVPEEPMDVVRQLPIIREQYPEMFEKVEREGEKEPLAYVPMRPQQARKARIMPKAGPISRINMPTKQNVSNTYWMNPDKLRLMQEDLILRRQQRLENSQ